MAENMSADLVAALDAAGVLVADAAIVAAKAELKARKAIAKRNAEAGVQGARMAVRASVYKRQRAERRERFAAAARVAGVRGFAIRVG